MKTNFILISCNDIFCGFNTLRYLFHHLQLFQQHTWLCYHHIICSYTVWWCSKILNIILCIMIYILKIRYQKHNFQINRNMQSNVLDIFDNYSWRIKDKCTNMKIQYKKQQRWYITLFVSIWALMTIRKTFDGFLMRGYFSQSSLFVVIHHV